MRIPLLLLIVLVGLPSCGGDSEVAGKWTLDIEATAELLATELAERAPGDRRASLRLDALELVKETLGPPLKVTLELKSGGDCEGSLQGRGASSPFVGKWSFKDEQIIVTRDDSDPQTLDYEDGKLFLRIPLSGRDGSKEETYVRAVLTKS
ncbi:MAG: hypothetical protein CMJ83_19665 [Planctomycetes bacterium]|nr:hypothetical protein [Planctomycetota bacterium]